MLTNLKVARMKAGWKQWELATKIGIDPAKLSLIETGRLIASEEIKKALGKALNQPHSILFPESKCMQSKEIRTEGGDKDEKGEISMSRMP